MKKKGIFLVAIMAFLLVVAGCANQSKQSAPTNKVETKLYNKLSKSSRDDVQFTFKRQEGTIKGQGSIDLTIKNQSNENVKFDLEDFEYLGADSLESSKSGMKTVKTNKEITIKSIFKDIDETIFSDPGLFCYKNDSFKLAYADGKVSKSNNLDDSELKKEYRHFMAHKDDVVTNSESSTVSDGSDNEADSNDTTSSTTTGDSNESNNADTDNTESTGNAVNSPDEAIALVQKEKGVGECFAFPTDEDSNNYLYDTSTGLQGYWIGVAHHTTIPGITTYATQFTVLTDGTILDSRPDLN